MRFLSHQTLQRMVTRYQLRAALLLFSCCGLTPEAVLTVNDGLPALTVADQRDVSHSKVVDAGTASDLVTACCLKHGSPRSARLLQAATSEQTAKQGKWRHLNAHTNQNSQRVAGTTGLVATTQNVRGTGSCPVTQPAYQASYAERVCSGGSRLT